MNAGNGNRDSTNVRKMLLALFLIGGIGTAFELLLLGHYEDVLQWIPLVLLALGVFVSALWMALGSPAILGAFRVIMLLCLVGGALGIFLHYRSNVEFELELNPSAGGTQLVWDSLTGAMPALAPGTMFHLGLVGLLYTYRHPALREKTSTAERRIGGT